MRVSDLVQRTGVPLATVKFYIRVGMLAPGRVTSARRAEYDDSHVERLQLIRALTVGAGLPLHRAKVILEIIDRPEGSLYVALGQAIDALSGAADDHEDVTDPLELFPRARAALPYLGEAYAASDDRMVAFAQLDEALLAADEVGMSVDPDRLRVYGEHVAAIARAELSGMPLIEPSQAIPYAVLGTALFEPVLAAIRRLAHQNLLAPGGELEE